MRVCSGKMTSPRPHEETSSAGDTTTPKAVDTGSSMASTVSTAFVGPILTSCQSQTPTPTTMGTMGQHMPSYTALIHKMLGMSAEFMANMHNLGLTYSDTSASPFPCYQGFGPLATPFGRPPGFGLTSQSVPIFTSSSIVVMRQQMDESNHEMVHMLTQQTGTILRPLIQDSTQSYQQLATQMTRIGYFWGAPRAQVRHNPTLPPRPETPVRQEEMTDDTVEQEYQ